MNWKDICLRPPQIPSQYIHLNVMQSLSWPVTPIYTSVFFPQTDGANKPLINFGSSLTPAIEQADK